MPNHDLRLERRGPVAIVTLDRPRVLNALRQSMLDRLQEILQELAYDDAVRVLIFTGTGRAFSAGIDLKEVGQGTTRASLERTQQLTRELIGHPKIVIAAINGLAVGLGAELCVAADLRIAAQSATFAFPEVKRALFETNGVTYLLPRIVGLGRAMEWFVTGDPVSAAEAHAAGLVNRLVGDDQLLDHAIEWANGIAANAPIPVRLVKQCLYQGLASDLERMLEAEVEGVVSCLETEDFREGIRAFVEKRLPQYAGR